jgi:hypothetical protein
MMRFHINLHIVLHDKKIAAVKALRDATGMGIAASKTFVETYINGTVDSFGGILICNAEQAAKIAELHFSNLSDFGFCDRPTFTIMNMKETFREGLDISDIVR